MTTETNLAPICLFVYNRLYETKKTVEALVENFLAIKSDLYIFSDGPKNATNSTKVLEVREYIKTISGFRNIIIHENKENLGLANSIISGVSTVIKKNGKVIVLEDDLITSKNFLDFMNQGLIAYQHTPKVFAISGYSYNLKYPKGYLFDASFGLRSYSWGWATWLDKWETVDWEVKRYNSFTKNKKARTEFAKGGSDLPAMLKKQMNHTIDSWMIRWVFQQFNNKQLDVFPRISKVINIGFSADATHTNCSSLRYNTSLDTSNSRNFNFPLQIEPNKDILKQFKDKISIKRRIIFKILDISRLSKLIIRLNQ